MTCNCLLNPLWLLAAGERCAASHTSSGCSLRCCCAGLLLWVLRRRQPWALPQGLLLLYG